MTNIPEEATVVEAQPEVVVVEQPAPAKKKKDGLAIAGFVLGIISVFILPLILGARATIFSAIGLTRAPKRNKGGKGLAIAGLILGIIGVVWGIFRMI